MTSEFAQVERRIVALEASTRRWRMAAALFGTLSLVMIATAFRSSRTQQVIEADRVTLRRTATLGTRVFTTSVELSVGTDGGLQVQFSGDSAQHRAASGSADLRLVDANGREIARLGPVRATSIGK